ncbi:MAG: dihydroorotate dehydrogenase electron transfer subunit, partial [Clostridia bacterium]
MRKDRQGIIISKSQVADGIFEMEIAFKDFENLIGGQFVHIQLPSEQFTLRRPFCICDFDNNKKTILICFAVVGKGTEYLASLAVGQAVMAMFPLGNGFVPTENMKKIVLVGGGMGSAVLPAVARENANVEFFTFLGFGNKNKVVLEERLNSLCKQVVVATDDGSCGEKGFV